MTLRARFQNSRIARSRAVRRFAPTLAATGWGESTYAELAWDKSRGAGRRWAIGGILFGALIGLVVFAPAAWLANAVARGSNERLLLADARGTIWSGSAVAVLTGGPQSRDAASLPGRLAWTLRPQGLGFRLRALHDCCLNGAVDLLIKPGFGRTTVVLLPATGWIGRWPSAWLGGLGTPWNTLQLGGTVQLSSTGLTLQSVQGRLLVAGQADIQLLDVSSRLSTLPVLGSYRFDINGDAANAGAAVLNLSTQSGSLQLSGNGTWSSSGIRFRGEGRASAADEAALSNLLNIIGRRQGARSVISIG